MEDEEIARLAKTAKWAHSIYAETGMARKVALVIDEKIELEGGEVLEFDSVSFHVIDILFNLQVWAERAIEHYNLMLPPHVLPRALNRAVDLGPANVHTFTRIGGDSNVMQFCCTGCGLETGGRITANFFSPHEFFIPSNRAGRERFSQPCREVVLAKIAI